jgi:hypothetical protein
MKRWSDKVKWGSIPESMRGGVIRYVENGIAPGHFLTAVLSNDLMEACNRGDTENIWLIPSYARLLVCECPPHCFGSPAYVRAWIARGGIEGNKTHEPLPVHEWSRWADQEYQD